MIKAVVIKDKDITLDNKFKFFVFGINYSLTNLNDKAYKIVDTINAIKLNKNTNNIVSLKSYNPK